MIHTYSSTIRRKEMEAVLNCMVDEKIGPGEMNARLVGAAKDLMGYAGGSFALRSPSLALEYIFKAMDLPKGSGVILSALAPAYQIFTIERCGYKALVCDVAESDGLMTVESVSRLVNRGGRLIILSEAMGILPDIRAFLELGVPVAEDISQSVFAKYPNNPESEEEGATAGTLGLFAILGMEEHDVITSGGGALLIAPGKREWTILKNIIDSSPSTDVLPDMNAALALIQLKEFPRNEEQRRQLFTLYSRAIAAGRHKTYTRAAGEGSTVYSFPLVLNAGFKEIKTYAQRRNVEIRAAYSDSVIALRQAELSQECICAMSLFLRCALFPLYPRLGQKDVAQVVKVLSSLP